jgi:hypothetical protein
LRKGVCLPPVQIIGCKLAATWIGADYLRDEAHCSQRCS